MKSFRWPLSGLYWRLTVSYFVVTLVVVVTVIGAGTFLSHLSDFQRSGDSVATRVLAVHKVLDLATHPEDLPPAQQIAPYLEQSSPDRAALQNWVLPKVYAYLMANTSAYLPLVAIVDRDQRVLAAGTCSPKTAGGTTEVKCPIGTGSADVLSFAPATSAISAALNGDVKTTDTIVALAGSESLVVVPVRAYDGHVLGAVAAVVDLVRTTTIPAGDFSSGWSTVASAFVSQLSSPYFYFVVLAIVVGTLSGILLSRSLRRRLLAITHAADAWSRGELEVTVRDSERDEVGQLARQLNAMAGQLQTLLATRQELAVVDERNRLARELHDSVKQQVFASALLVRAARKSIAANPEAAASHLAEAEQLAGQTQQELTMLIRALRPAAIADRGLVAVLRDWAADWLRQTGISAEVRVAGERETPIEIEEALFRVAQEALTNVARHSGARTAELRLEWADNALGLSVVDDGSGFDPRATDGTGLGLASMRERVAALGGTLQLASGAGGTRVEVNVPLDRTKVTGE